MVVHLVLLKNVQYLNDVNLKKGDIKMTRCPHCDEEIEIHPKSKRGVTHVIILLDETGSMGGIREQTISSFNEYIDTLKSSGNKFKVTLTKFNSNRIKTVYSNRDINNVIKLTKKSYIPRAMTPLYDAMAKTINKVKDNEYDKVLFVVQTDGYENYSKEFLTSYFKKINS